MIPVELPPANGDLDGPGRVRRDAGSDAWGSAWQREMERQQASGWFGHGLVGGLPAAGPSHASTNAAQTSHQGPLAQVQRLQQAPGTDGAQGQQNLSAGASIAGPKLFAQEAAEPSWLGPASSAAATLALPPSPAQASAMAALVQGLHAAVPGLVLLASAQLADIQEPAQAIPCAPSTAPSVRRDAMRPASAADEPPAQRPLADVDRPSAATQAVPRQAVRLHAEWTAAGVRLWLGMDAGAALPAAWLAQQLQRSLAASGCRLLNLTCNGHPVPLAPDGITTSTFLKETEGPSWPSTQ